MRIVDPGHRYLLDSLDGEHSQELRFVKREGFGYPGNVGAYAGTTIQDVLRCLIDRAEYVNNQIPCPETEAAAGMMRAALYLFEVRAGRRKSRHLEFGSLSAFEDAIPCAECGHVQCAEHSA